MNWTGPLTLLALTATLIERPRLDVYCPDTEQGRLVSAELTRDWSAYPEAQRHAWCRYTLSRDAQVRVIDRYHAEAPPLAHCHYRLAASRYARSWEPIPVQAMSVSTYPLHWCRAEVDRWRLHWQLIEYNRINQRYWQTFGWDNESPEPRMPKNPINPWEYRSQ